MIGFVFDIPFISDFWQIIIYYCLGFVVTAILLLLVVLLLVLFERKLLAHFTVRLGPNRVGICGILQTVADALKLLFKEDIVPNKADKFMHTLAPILVFVPIMTVWTFIPYNSGFAVYNSVVGALVFLSLLSFPILGILFAGISSGNKYAILGSMRSCVQTLSYELPIFISLISIVLLAQSIDLSDIVSMQASSKGIFNWFFIPDILGFVIFFISALAMMNRIPFDFPEAESEFVAGYHSEYSGMKFAMFFLAEYAATFILCAFMATIFFGGYLSPFGIYIADIVDVTDFIKTILLYFEQFFWIIFKTVLLITVVIWTRATLPRLRIDKSINFFWCVLLPLSILNLFIVAIIQFFRLRGV